MGNTRERSAKGITNQGRLTTTNPARLADHRQQERPAQVTVRGLREEHRHNLKGVWISLYESSVNLIISVNVPLVCRRRLGRVWILWIYNPHGRNSYTLGNPDSLRNSWDNGGEIPTRTGYSITQQSPNHLTAMIARDRRGEWFWRELVLPIQRSGTMSLPLFVMPSLFLHDWVAWVSASKNWASQCFERGRGTTDK